MPARASQKQKLASACSSPEPDLSGILSSSSGSDGEEFSSERLAEAGLSNAVFASVMKPKSMVSKEKPFANQEIATKGNSAAKVPQKSTDLPPKGLIKASAYKPDAEDVISKKVRSKQPSYNGTDIPRQRTKDEPVDPYSTKGLPVASASLGEVDGRPSSRGGAVHEVDGRPGTRNGTRPPTRSMASQGQQGFGLSANPPRPAPGGRIAPLPSAPHLTSPNPRQGSPLRAAAPLPAPGAQRGPAFNPLHEKEPLHLKEPHTKDPLPHRDPSTVAVAQGNSKGGGLIGMPMGTTSKLQRIAQGGKAEVKQPSGKKASADMSTFLDALSSDEEGGAEGVDVSKIGDVLSNLDLKEKEKKIAKANEERLAKEEERAAREKLEQAAKESEERAAKAAEAASATKGEPSVDSAKDKHLKKVAKMMRQLLVELLDHAIMEAEVERMIRQADEMRAAEQGEAGELESSQEPVHTGPVEVQDAFAGLLAATTLPATKQHTEKASAAPNRSKLFTVKDDFGHVLAAKPSTGLGPKVAPLNESAATGGSGVQNGTNINGVPFVPSQGMARYAMRSVC